MGIFMTIVWGPFLLAGLAFIMRTEYQSLRNKMNDGQSIAEDVTSLTLSAALGLTFLVLFAGGF
jgi:hypothetical protein